MRSTANMLTSNDLMTKSKETLEPAVFDFISGGSGAEWGVLNNNQAFQRYQIIPRVLQQSGKIETDVCLFNQTSPFPIIIAPCAFHKLVCSQGELATAKAAEKTNTIFTLSTMSTYSIEEVAKASNTNKWFQLYIFKDKEITMQLIKRAEKAGYTALVVTVDVPAMGMRIRDIKNQFALPKDMTAANFGTPELSLLSNKSNGSKVKDHTDQQFDANLSWDTIDWLQSLTQLPIILKGILSPEDAAEAIKHNVAGIVVSNHGGRQLDSAIAPIDILPEIARIVNNQIPIIVDGGIRSGEDIFKALALGANAVMIARPVMWALSIGGEEALINLLTRLQTELILTMRLSGCNNLNIIKQQNLALLSGANITQLKLFDLLSRLETSPSKEITEKKPAHLFFSNH